jgi:cell filamentation protein
MSDYFVDGESLLSNKLGIEDTDELKRAEEEIVAVRMAELIGSPVRGSFDFKMLRAIHEKLFSDLYDFAGKVRTVRIAKDGSVFCYPEFIEDSQKIIFDRLEKQNNLKGLPKEEFVRQYAALAGELNALHPFREGNGRAIRLFLRQLAENAEWYVAYEDMEAEELLNADICSFHGELVPLTELLSRHISEYLGAGSKDSA